ncbi:MAG TPA: hypothetical protein VNN17_09080 [Terriglobia bacterium]|nr:hypothetical protein [Terriglobia bacterium]
MTAAASARTIPGRKTSGQTAIVLAQAVRNSLNLPHLRVLARPGREPGSWQVRVGNGSAQSEWITLPPGAVAVAKKVALLPPRLLGHFRLAYAALRAAETEVKRRKEASLLAREHPRRNPAGTHATRRI